MAQAQKRRRRGSGCEASRRPRAPLAVAPRDLLEDVFESGGVLFLAIGCTPAGAPFGPRVEIVDGELHFPDEQPLDMDVEPDEPDAFSDGRATGRDIPF
jgi:hypothetical protein